MKKSSLSLSKFKVKFDLTYHQIYSSISSLIMIKESHLVLKITDNEKFLTNKTLKKDTVKMCFHPIYNDQDEIHVQYALIQLLILTATKLSIKIFNPSLNESITIDLYDFVDPGLFRDKRITLQDLHSIYNHLNYRKAESTKEIISKLSFFFTVIFKGMSSKESLTYELEQTFHKSIGITKHYYNSSIDELKKNELVKNNIKNKIIEKEKKNIVRINNESYLISNNKNSTGSNGAKVQKTKEMPNIVDISKDSHLTKFMISSNQTNLKFPNFDKIFLNLIKSSLYNLKISFLILLQILELNSKNIDLDKVKTVKVSKEIRKINFKENTLQNQIEKKKNINLSMNLEKHEKLEDKGILKSANESFDNNILKYSMEDYKLKSIKEQIKLSQKNILFQNKDNTEENNKLDNSQDIQNMIEEFGYQISLEDVKENKFDTLLKSQENVINNLSKPDISENDMDTPKFFKKKQIIPIQKKPAEPKTIKKSITKYIDELYKNHSFVPPNQYENILANTNEYCHRKFFELLIEEHFPKIVCLEKDKFGILKMESIISFFYIMKNLKNMLFTNENRLYYANNVFEN